MAITAAQRTEAVTLLVQNAQNAQVLNQLVPGLTPTNLITNLVSAIGTNFDAGLTTCLASLVTSLNANLTATESAVTAVQSQITAATVQ